MFDFRILGPLEVVGGATPMTLPAGRGRALLAVLIIRCGVVVSVDRLIDELWGPEPPPTARSKIHVLVSDLRRRFEAVAPGTPDPIVTRSPGYQLDVGGDAVDAARFRSLVVEASTVSPGRRSEILRAALGLWRGPALADFALEPFAQSEIASLEEQRTVALEDRIEADLALGSHADLLAELRRLVDDHPFRERFTAQLMLALYRGGRQSEALAAYRQTQLRLREELGIEPGPGLRDLEDRILRQEPSLDLLQTSSPSMQGGDQRAWITDGRKLVTVVFTELTWLGEPSPSDPEVMQRVIGIAFEHVSDILSRHGGTVEGLIGGVIVAVFGVPVAHEDDAARAVQAAKEIAGAFRATDHRVGRVSVRTGVNTGEVVVGAHGPGRTSASGATTDLAARLMRDARDGEFRVGPTTRALVGVEFGADPVGSLPPMLGREAEARMLHEALDRALGDLSAGVALVIGEAGIGKSRLVQEFARSLDPATTVLTGRCPAYGEGITFLPLREIVEQAAGARDAGAVAALLGTADDDPTFAALAESIGLAEGSASPTEVFLSFRRFFEIVARDRAVVVVLEDLHWAEPTLLDLFDYLASTVQARVLFVGVARPDVIERFPPQAMQHERCLRIDVGPLGPEDSRTLLEGGVRHVPDIERVAALAQGNPLFLHQLQAASRSDVELGMPATIQALLASRLDRLGPAERDLLRCASIIGETFPIPALTVLVPDAARPFIARHLEALTEQRLVSPVAARGGVPTFGFVHALIHDAAYRSLTRRARSELHEAHAEWLDGDAAEGSFRFEETVGHHLEQAAEHRRALGLHDARTADLGRRAGERLGSSGLRAYARLDVPAAVNLLDRAAALLPADHTLSTEVTRHLPEAHEMLGQHAEADRVLAAALERMDASDARRRCRTVLERARISLTVGPDPAPLESVTAIAEEAVRAFEAWGDDAGVSQALAVLGLAALRRGDPAEMERLAQAALWHAEASGYQREAITARWWVALALVMGERPVSECLVECGRMLSDAGDRIGVPVEMAHLLAMRGEFDAARDLTTETLDLLRERLRARRPVMFTTIRVGEIETLAGEVDRARSAYRESLDTAVSMGEAQVIANVAGNLSLLLDADDDEAMHLATLSRLRAPREDVQTQAIWRAAMGRLLAVDGSTEEGTRLVGEAVDIVPNSMPNLRADRLVDLAGVLRRAGGSGGAPLRDAVDLYERKGNLTAARRTARLRA